MLLLPSFIFLTSQFGGYMYFDDDDFDFIASLIFTDNFLGFGKSSDVSDDERCFRKQNNHRKF